MCQIRRILLAVSQAQQPGQVELRAGLLGSQSNLRSQLWTAHDGSTADAIAEVAERRKAELLVLAAPRRHPFLEWVLPSPAMQLMRRSRIPVLLVKQAPGRAYRKVVVATDFAAASIKAARTASLIAPGAHFIFLHAWRLPEERLMRELELRPELVAMYRSRARDAAQRRLASCFADFSSRVTRASSMLGHGAPQQVIEACARQVGADLIVLGRGAGTASGRPGVGLATRRLVAGSDCDVLIDE